MDESFQIVNKWLRPLSVTFKEGFAETMIFPETDPFTRDVVETLLPYFDVLGIRDGDDTEHSLSEEIISNGTICYCMAFTLSVLQSGSFFRKERLLRLMLMYILLDHYIDDPRSQDRYEILTALKNVLYRQELPLN